MYDSELQLQIDGTIGLEEAIEFLDKDEIKVVYNGQEVPKIKVSTRDSKENRVTWIDENYYLSKSLEWIRKAKSEKDGFNKLFALWVGYNAFYNFYSQKKERELNNCVSRKYRRKWELCKIVLTQDLVTNEEQKMLLKKCLPKIKKLLSETYHVYLGWGRSRNDIKKELEKNLQKFEENSDNNKNTEQTFESLLKLLYGIRNNLFHGEKLLSDSRQDELLIYAYEILLSILSLMLIKYLIRHHSGDSNAPRQTRR